MENQSPVQRIWELGKDEHGRLITAVVLAVLGVIGGMVPYFGSRKSDRAAACRGKCTRGIYAVAALCARRIPHTHRALYTRN